MTVSTSTESLDFSTPGSYFVIDLQNPATSSVMGGTQGTPTQDLAFPDDPNQVAWRGLISRRHPMYHYNLPHWLFVSATYEGGRGWFKPNIFRYVKEGDREYNERIRRAYRFNHSREVVDLLNKYLFRQNIIRKADEAPKQVQNFWNRATRNGLTIDEFARQFSQRTSIFGRCAIVVDTTAPADNLSVAEAKELGSRVYSYIVEPPDLLDYAFDDDGDLLWVLIHELKRDDGDPMTSSGAYVDNFRLWTRTGWQLFELTRDQKGKLIIKLIEEGEYDLGGQVPVILADNQISSTPYDAQGLIDEIAYLDRAVGNYLSNLDAIIQDQTFSQLAMPAQGVLPGEDDYNKLIEIGTKRVFLYDGEAGAVPFFLSPDVKQASLIVNVINKIINEIYHTVGLAGERTKEDNSVGIDNSSGVAKAYDFERVNALLVSKAQSIEFVERKLVELVALWNDVALPADVDLVKYPRDFDTRNLYDEFDIAGKLVLIDAPDMVRKEQMKMLVSKLFPQLKQDLIKQIESEIDSPQWPIDQMAIQGLTPSLNQKKDVPPVKRQGQVTAATTDS